MAAILWEMSQSMSEFDEFWSLYPRRLAKGAARKAHAAALRKARHGDIQAGLLLYLATIAAEGTAPRYVKHPSTWLNGECWGDDLSAVVQSGRNGQARSSAKTDELYAQCLRGGVRIANLTDQYVAALVTAGRLTKKEALDCGYAVERLC